MLQVDETRGCTCRDEREVATEAEHAADYLRGLVAEVEHKNGWQLAERAGYRHPRGIQRVLDRYIWDADAVRDDTPRHMMLDTSLP